MVAGRELDALVAEKVMGWTGRFLFRQRKNEGAWIIGFQENTDAHRVGRFSRYYRDDGAKLYCGRPHSVHVAPYYSADMGDAWEVWEKLVADGWYPDLVTTYSHEWGCVAYVCTLHHADREDAPFSKVARAATHAISLAALAAVGASTPGAE